MADHQTTAAEQPRSLCLSDLKQGEAATIERLEMTGEQRWRLMDLGFLPGTRVVAELSGPLGEPTAYRVRDALVALRDDQASLIHVSRQERNS
jgi:Fe2+ transport system protein FeoA